jgi:hypothetical protein
VAAAAERAARDAAAADESADADPDAAAERDARDAASRLRATSSTIDNLDMFRSRFV